MATYNSKSAKSRVSSKAKKGGFKFKWWMGVVIVVVIIAVVGLVVIRFSHASGVYSFSGALRPVRVTSNTIPRSNYEKPFGQRNDCLATAGDYYAGCDGFRVRITQPDQTVFDTAVYPYAVDPGGNLILRIYDPANNDCGVMSTGRVNSKFGNVPVGTFTGTLSGTEIKTVNPSQSLVNFVNSSGTGFWTPVTCR